MKTLLYNAQIINRDRRFQGFVEIDGDKISHIGEGNPDAGLLHYYGENAIDLKGHWLLPGAIDSHVHFREPGLTHKADIHSESRAAIAGGVTSFIDMPNTKPATLSMADIDDKCSIAASESWANYAFYIGASADNINELREADYTRVPGIKLFLGSSTGNMCVSDEKVLDEIFSLPHLIAVHCEDEEVINFNSSALRKIYGNNPAPIAWHPVVRSELACYKSTEAAIRRAMRFGTRLHICHITTEEELQLAEGKKNITLEACIPHLWFTDEDYDRKGAFIKCNPAVKSSRHRKAMRQALSTGAISVVSTDHAPHTVEEKEGDLFTAPSGMPMVQFSLRAMLQLAAQGMLTPERVVRLMCHNQADLLSIKDRGYIDERCYADLVEIDPEGSGKPVDNCEVISKCGWTPMHGEQLDAAVRRVWVNGSLTYADGNFSSESSAMPLRFEE